MHITHFGKDVIMIRIYAKVFENMYNNSIGHVEIYLYKINDFFQISSPSESARNILQTIMSIKAFTSLKI